MIEDSLSNNQREPGRAAAAAEYDRCLRFHFAAITKSRVRLLLVLNRIMIDVGS
jgi:hypothetical protein